MTRSIPAKLGLGALLIAYGCNEVFVLGDVADASGSTGGSGGSNGSRGADAAESSTPSAGGAGGGLAGVTEGNVTTSRSEDSAASSGGNTDDVGVSSATESGAATATTAGTGGAANAGAATSTGGGGSGSVTGGVAGETGAGGETICEPGPPPQTEARCCSTGTRTRDYRFDTDTCTYITSKWSACSVPKECADGMVETEIGHCSNGRWRERIRTCDTCGWGEWIEGECQGNADTCTGCACVSWCADPDTGGTTCLWIACTEAEARAECDQDVAALCGTRRDPFTFLEWLPN